MAEVFQWYARLDWGRPPMSRDEVVIYGDPPAEIVCPRRSTAFTHSGLIAVGRCDERAPVKSARALHGEGCGAGCPARAALLEARQRASADTSAPSTARALMMERLLAVLSQQTTGMTGQAAVAAVRQRWPEPAFGDESLRSALAKLVDERLVVIDWPRGADWGTGVGARYRLVASGLSLAAADGGAR